MKLKEVKYVPVSVKEILKEMSDLSSLMIDLAYTSYLFNNKPLAEEVMKLEERVDYLSYLLLMNASLAVRDKEDAEQIAGILKVASAVDGISNAAADIANLVLLGITAHELVWYAFEDTYETVDAFEIPPNRGFENKTLEDLSFESKLGINIIAVRKGSRWILNPPDNLVVNVGDVIIVRGGVDSIEHMERIFGQVKEKKYEVASSEWKKVGKMIEDLKDISEFMIYLAYSSLLFNNKDLAREVQELEEYVDSLHMKFELSILKMASSLSDDEKKILGLLRLGIATENIADAAALMAEITLRGLEPHPILKTVVDESEELIIAIKVLERSEIANKRLYDTNLEEIGAIVLAVRRNKEWFFKPDDNFVFLPNDVIIVRIYPETRHELIRLVGIPAEDEARVES
ncbi:MAG: potassium channel family protein [Candidatus Asgardarchaeia archaeon]